MVSTPSPFTSKDLNNRPKSEISLSDNYEAINEASKSIPKN